MIHLEFSSLIQRPIAEVYAFISTPTNIPRWQSNIREVKPSSTGPVAVGSTFQSAGEIIGRKIEGTLTVIEMDPEKKFGFRGNNGPMTVNIHLNFKALGTGTKLSLSIDAEPGGAFKLAEGLLTNQLKGQMEKNFAALKTLLETGG